jgi:hypothetical protein
MQALPQPFALGDGAVPLHTPGSIARTPSATAAAAAAAAAAARSASASAPASVVLPHSQPHAPSTSGAQPMQVDETVRELFPTTREDDAVAAAAAAAAETETGTPMRSGEPAAVVTPGASPMDVGGLVTPRAAEGGGGGSGREASSLNQGVNLSTKKQRVWAPDRQATLERFLLHSSPAPADAERAAAAAAAAPGTPGLAGAAAVATVVLRRRGTQ